MVFDLEWEREVGVEIESKRREWQNRACGSWQKYPASQQKRIAYQVIPNIHRQMKKADKLFYSKFLL